MKLSVDSASRSAKMRAHTVTHLLHYALDKMLWGTKQSGSLVDDDYLRFDFTCQDALTPDQLSQLEYTVNTWISWGYPVSVTEMSFDEASKTWAKAFFEDKYGDMVRVVRIEGSVDEDLDLHSTELCGGTHVTDTSHIWAFKITAHTSVASGIRRIEAVTATKVTEESQKHELRLWALASRLDCQPKQLENKIEKIMKEYTQLQSDMESLQSQLIWSHLETIINTPSSSSWATSVWTTDWVDGSREYVIDTSSSDLQHHAFKEVVNQAKSKRTDRNWILYTKEGNFAIYAGAWEISAKQFAKDHQLKWGGSDQFVQGRDVRILEVVK